MAEVSVLTEVTLLGCRYPSIDFPWFRLGTVTSVFSVTSVIMPSREDIIMEPNVTFRTMIDLLVY